MAFQKLLEQDFDTLDRTHKGYVTTKEVEQACRAFGLERSVAQEFIKFCDGDRDGRVTKDDFIRAQNRRKSRRVSQQDTRAVFSRLDSSGSGRMDFEKFKTFIKVRNKHCSDEQLKRIFQTYDKTGKGYLNSVEFDTLVRDYSK